jgi:hypothetical protein
MSLTLEMLCISVPTSYDDGSSDKLSANEIQEKWF